MIEVVVILFFFPTIIGIELISGQEEYLVSVDCGKDWQDGI